jgi:acetylornithine deacetylase/succinyl-diaminopimelate desuccinylase-like protein
MSQANVGDDKRRAIAAQVDERTDELVELLRELVSIRSVNPVFQDSEPLEEERCQRFLAARLEHLGFETVFHLAVRTASTVL